MPLYRIKKQISRVNAFPHVAVFGRWGRGYLEPGDIVETRPGGSAKPGVDYEELRDPRDYRVPKTLGELWIDCKVLLAWMKDDGHRLPNYLVHKVAGERLQTLVDRYAQLMKPGDPLFDKNLREATAVPQVEALVKYLLGLIKPTSKDDDTTGGQATEVEWSEAKAPADWRKEFEVSASTLRRWKDAGKIVVDPITTKSWRIRKDSLDRIRGTK